MRCEQCKQWIFFHAYKGQEGNLGECKLKTRLKGNRRSSIFYTLFYFSTLANKSCTRKFRLFMRLIYILKRLMWRKNTHV